MIENPKVGMQVVVYDADGRQRIATVVRRQAGGPITQREYLVQDGGWMAWRPAAELHELEQEGAT